MLLEHLTFSLMIAAIVAPFSYYAGLGARLLKLPQITGYLISGIICGPYVLGILSKESVMDLNILESSCLSIIGLAAGAELDLQQLSKSRKQVVGITLGICLTSWVLCYAAFDWISIALPLMPDMDSRHLLATASLGATLMMTRSPASAIAVMKEMEGKGPFCSLVMAVVVVKDVFVIVAFALNIELIRVAILPTNAAQQLSLVNLSLPMLNVLLAVAIGICGGLLLSIAMKPRVQLPSLLSLSPEQAVASRPRMLVLVVLSTAIFQLSHYFDAEPLLACVAMGMVLVNRRHDRIPDKEREEQHREEHLRTLQQIMSYSNVAFFGLAGASLKLSALRSMFVAALVVTAVRLVAIYLGSWLGCFVTSTMPEVRRVFWMSMVTQAGVAMGLARLAGTRFPDWGPSFQTFMVSIILINLLIGPPLFRFALIRVGETKGQPHVLLGNSHNKEKEPSGGGAATAVVSGHETDI